MIRRSFRRGLTLGLLAGAVMTAVKTVQSRRTAPATPEWPSMPAPDPQPARPVSPVPVSPVPVSTVETHAGTEADEHFADTDRQPDEVMPDWERSAAAQLADLPPDASAAPTPQPVSGDVAKVAAAPKKAAKKPAPDKVAKVAKATKKAAPAALAAWVEPVEGACPSTHPVKAKLTSKIFHLPGGFNYERTRPDRCYLDAPAAEADGLRPSKR